MCVCEPAKLRVCLFVGKWEVFVRRPHFSSHCNSLLAQQGLVDPSLFLLQQCAIDCTCISFERLSKSLHLVSVSANG